MLHHVYLEQQAAERIQWRTDCHQQRGEPGQERPEPPRREAPRHLHVELPVAAPVHAAGDEQQGEEPRPYGPGGENGCGDGTHGLGLSTTTWAASWAGG